MQTNKIWWFNPISITAFVHIPILIIAFLLDEKWYRFTASQVKEIDSISFFLGLLGFIVFCIATYIGTNTSNKNVNYKYILEEQKLNSIVVMMTSLYLIANLLLFYEFIKNPAYFVMIANAELEQGYGRQLAQTIPGVTTLSQLGICLAVICSYKISFGYDKRNYIILISFIILISLIRAFVRSERLALIEVIVVFVIPFVLLKKEYNKFFRLIPILALPGLITVFSVSEYFRSWIHYYSKRYEFFYEFIFDRFSSYFIIAQNSGISYWKAIEQNTYPWLTQQWFFKLPGFKNLNSLYASEYERYMSYLRIHLDPQYNNYAPIFAIYTDYGLYLGFFIILLLGLLTGYFYKSFIKQNGVGIFIYPAWFIGVLELSRTFSWGSSRFFIVFLTFIVIFFYCSRKAKS